MLSDLDNRMALDALGLLTTEERHALRDELAGTGGPERATMFDVAASLAWRCFAVEPPLEARNQLMARIAASPKPYVAPQLSFVMQDEGWQPHPLVAGIRFKQLALDLQRGVATLLLKVEPGTIYPAHRHRGNEECYVIEGDVTAAGRRLEAGDFHHADAGSDHEPLRTEGGCTVLLVVDARDYLG